MPLKHINQAKHNLRLLKILRDSEPNNYFDWKITILFYSALHLVSAFSSFQKTSIGNSHVARNHNLNPKNSNASLPLSRNAYLSYYELYRISRTSRYYGFWKQKSFQKRMESQFNLALGNYKTLETYLRKNKLKF